MGKYNKGILGAFSGKVGNVVGASWRGMDVLRSLPRAGTSAPTENQLQQREKFALVARFLLPFKPMLASYFGQPSGGRSRTNQASSYHLREAVVLNGSVLSMNYAKVLLSRGDLQGATQAAVAASAGNLLRFSWADNSGQATAKPTDRLMVGVHDAESGFSDFFLAAGTRDQAAAEITLPDYYAGAQVHCWMAFASENGKLNSTSIYMGTVEVV